MKNINKHNSTPKIILSQKGKTVEFLIAAILVFVGIFIRLLPHPPNLTSVAAIALFGGVYFPRKVALILPMVIMIISDIFIGFYEPKLMIFVYGSFLLCAVLGFWLKKHKRWYTVLGSSLSCSFAFFFLTNFAVWAFTSWYPKTFSGIIECYLMALPFFKNTLVGDLFYVITFFGIFEIIKIWVRKRFGVLAKTPISVN